MRNLTLALLVLLLTGCGGEANVRQPQLPEKVTVTVEKYRDLPAWATARVTKPLPADGTVGARATSHDARGATIDYVNCLHDLLARLVKGEATDPKSCAP